MDWDKLSFMDYFNIASAILWFVYVVITIFTFWEIRKQTDLLSRGLLNIRPTIALDNSTVKCEATAKEVFAKWRDLIIGVDSTFEIANLDVFTLILMNRGRSDIVDWDIKITLEIDPRSKISTHQPYSISWTIDSSKWGQIPPAESINIPVVIVSCFPKYKIKWEATYTDIRGKTYEHYKFKNTYEGTYGEEV